MIVWRGRGGAVALVTFLILLAVNFLADFFGGEGYWQENKIFLGLGCVFAGAFTLFLHRGTDYSKRVLIDQKTGEAFSLEPKHDLFFIPIKYWPFIFAFFGLINVIFWLIPK